MVNQFKLLRIFNPSVIQTGGDRYSLLQHSTGNTYLNGVDNTDIMVNDIGKIRMTTTDTTMDNSNTYIRTGGLGYNNSYW